MKPIAPLMMEHRLIERMLGLLRREADRIEKEQQIDPAFIDSSIDFIRIYADKTHHAKEEDILFRDLGEMQMSHADQELMQDLLADHQFGRKTVREIFEAKERLLQGESGVLRDIPQKLITLADFYKEHIRKEDDLFFPSCMAYLTQEEQEAMLEEFWEADRKMIHFKYRSLVEYFEEKKS